MSRDKLHQAVQILHQAVKGNEQLPLSLLSVKLAKCLQNYPHDKTIGGMACLISDMESNKTSFIRQADFKSLSNKMHTVGTKFAELFKEELGEKPAEPQITLQQHDQSLQAPSYQPQDQVLVNALESVFDRHLPVKMFSQASADQALKSVSRTLEGWNLSPSQLSIGCGNDRFIIIKANYETPKGKTSFYVPVEVSAKNNVIDPEVFLGNAGAEDLNHSSIKSYLQQQAGTKTKIGANDILAVLTEAASEKRQISNAELALTRLNATKQGKGDFFNDQILGLKVEAQAKSDVQMHKLDTFASWEQQLTSPQGQAAYQFGEDKVAAGRNHITRQLQSFGFSSPQVVVLRNDRETVFYGVSLDTGKVAFTVPVKINKGQVSQPTVLICQGSLANFDQEGINQLVSENKNDVKIAAVASSMASLKPSEILGNLRQAISEGNHIKAEDALNVLANSEDQKAFFTGFQLYMDGLAGKKATTYKCSKMIKNATSEHPICSHTGLPIHKVYQDKDGFCRPLFRQGMAETYEGASFINAKIFG